MKKSFLFWAVVLVVAAGALVGAYFLGKGKAAKIDDNLLSELEELRANQSKAAVVKRVSQQMENIAYQQKAVSEQERDRAEQQSELAMAMRDRAEQEKKAAREAEQRAVDAAMEAEEERAISISHQIEAEMQRDEATYAKRVTDTLSYRTLGRTISNSSITQFEGGHTELAGQLAYAGWYFLDKFGGNTYQPETFDALSNSTDTKKSISVLKGGAVTGLFPVKDIGCVAVTDYGEIEIHRKIGVRRKVLLQNSDFNFRSVWVDNDTDSAKIYALSLHGPLCIVDLKSKTTGIELPYDTYYSVEEYDPSHLIITARNNIIVFDRIDNIITRKFVKDNPIATVTRGPEGFTIFYMDGSSEIMNENFDFIPSERIEGRTATCAYYDPALQAFFVGCSNGDVLLMDKNQKIITPLFGHIGRVSNLITSEDILISLSYDKNAYIWNLPLLKLESGKPLSEILGIDSSLLNSNANLSNNEWLTPASVKYEGWPLSICHFSDHEIAVGTSNGLVQRFNTSVKEMAGMLKKSGKISISREDWIHYIGSVPYVNF